MEIAVFLGAILASMLEPFTLFGCLAIGALIHKLGLALPAGIGWGLFVQLVIIKPRVEFLETEYGSEMLAAGILAAFLTTLAVHHMANSKPRDG